MCPEGGKVKQIKASITVEAAMIMPIVLWVCIAFIYLIKTIQFEQDLYYAMCETADIVSTLQVPYENLQNKDGTDSNSTSKTMAGDLDEDKFSSYLKKIGKNSFVKAAIVKNMGDKKDNPSVSGGFSAVTFLGSSIVEDDKDIVIVARYGIHIPFVSVIVGNKVQSVRICTRAFVGNDSISKDVGKDEELVYVTDTGKVYHTDRDCSYIKVKTKKVAASDIVNQRNESGAKYYACSVCGSESEKCSSYYICTYGTRYHASLGCSELKRTVKTIKKSEAGEMKKCAKCPD